MFTDFKRFHNTCDISEQGKGALSSRTKVMNPSESNYFSIWKIVVLTRMTANFSKSLQTIKIANVPTNFCQFSPLRSCATAVLLLLGLNQITVFNSCFFQLKFNSLREQWFKFVIFFGIYILVCSSTK